MYIVYCILKCFNNKLSYIIEGAGLQDEPRE